MRMSLRVAKKVWRYERERAVMSPLRWYRAVARLWRGHRRHSRLLHFPREANDAIIVKYVVEGGYAVPARDFGDFILYQERADRQVRETRLGVVRVSTVFLGMAAPRFTCTGEIRGALWETMTFVDKGAWGLDEVDHLQRRYDTESEAIHGHKVLVRAVQMALARKQRAGSWADR